MTNVKPISENSLPERLAPEAHTALIAEHKAFVLLSGGLDSTTALYKALQDYGDAEAVTINYGQRHSKEISHAHETCNYLGIDHTVLNLPSDILGGAMLTDRNINIPNVSYADLPPGVSPTYVPYRNGTLLALITAYAQKWVNAAPPDLPREAGVYFGAHSEDAHNWAYPDCTPEFIGAQANAIYIGSYRTIRLRAPFMWLFKKDIVKLGQELEVRFDLTWSCYKGEERHCGICPTCRSRRLAFVDADVSDPTEYSIDPAESGLAQ